MADRGEKQYKQFLTQTLAHDDAWTLEGVGLKTSVHGKRIWMQFPYEHNTLFTSIRLKWNSSSADNGIWSKMYHRDDSTNLTEGFTEFAPSVSKTGLGINVAIIPVSGFFTNPNDVISMYFKSIVVSGWVTLLGIGIETQIRTL